MPVERVCTCGVHLQGLVVVVGDVLVLDVVHHVGEFAHEVLESVLGVALSQFVSLVVGGQP